MSSNSYFAIGRRKSSVCRLFMKKGTGKITINNRDIDEEYYNYKYELGWLYHTLAWCYNKKENISLTEKYYKLALDILISSIIEFFPGKTMPTYLVKLQRAIFKFV